MRKSLLVKLVRIMFLMLVLAFVFVLLSSLKGPSLTTSVNSPFDDVEIGETTLRRYQGKRVWVTRLSPQLVQALESIDSLVVDKAIGCDPQQTLCAVMANTKTDGIEIRYSANRPANVSRSTPWAGGFIDPTTGAIFDVLGRAYLLQHFTAFNTDIDSDATLEIVSSVQ